MPRWAIILIVGFLVRWVPLALPFEFSGPDSASYVEPAASLAAGAGYSDRLGHPTAVRPPGYPLLLAAVFWLQGSDSAAGPRVAQALLGALAAVLVAGLLARTHPPWATVGGLLVALDPIAVGQSPFLLREALLLFLLTALLFVLATRRGRARFALAAVLLVSLALTHQLYVLLGPFLLAADQLALRRAPARGRLWNLAAWIAIGLLVGLALVLWARRNERVLGHFSLTGSANAVPARELWLTSECSNNWLSGDYATGFQYLAFSEEQHLVDTVGMAAAKRELYARAWANWRDHPLRSLARLTRINFWYWAEIPGAVRLAAHERIYWVRWALLPFHWARLAAALAGVMLLVRTGARSAHARYALGTLAFFALAPALLYPVPRYLSPASPLLDLLAVLGVGSSLTGRGRG